MRQNNEGIAKLPPNRQIAASEGEEQKRSVVTTPSLSDGAVAPRREGSWDESFAIPSNDSGKAGRDLAAVVSKRRMD
ncbi:MAG: hypothetical protein IJJ26_11170 [Victivallales bacterium]|nr:hypothetical protein [Victivallales bacterium]